MNKSSKIQAVSAQLSRMGLYDEIWDVAREMGSRTEHTHFYLLSVPELHVLSNVFAELESYRHAEFILKGGSINV